MFGGLCNIVVFGQSLLDRATTTSNHIEADYWHTARTFRQPKASGRRKQPTAPGHRSNRESREKRNTFSNALQTHRATYQTITVPVTVDKFAEHAYTISTSQANVDKAVTNRLPSQAQHKSSIFVQRRIAALPQRVRASRCFNHKRTKLLFAPEANFEGLLRAQIYPNMLRATVNSYKNGRSLV